MRSGLDRAIGLALALSLAPAAYAAETVPLSDVAHIHGIALDPGDSGRVLLATHHGLYRAAPDGTAQRLSRTRDDLMGFVPHPVDKSTFFASGHPERGGNLGFVVSTDGGVNWTRLSPGLQGPVDFHQMDVSKSDPSIIYGVFNGLQRSRDGGKSWEMIGPAPERLFDIAVAPRDPGTLYAATREGLLISGDAGKSWRPAMILRRPATMVETTADGAVYAYLVGNGLMRGDGNGWTTLGPLPGNAAMLHFAKGPDRLYAVTDRDQVLVSPDEGRSWQPFAQR